MRTDNRLPRVLHILLHLDEMSEPVTSERMGEMFGMDASLVRRTMGGLRKYGLVTSIKGHGGGWHLQRPTAEISLLEVYTALGSPNVFAIGAPEPSSPCLLEHAATDATRAAMEAARRVFEHELKGVSVADLASRMKTEMPT
ncbi:Rrf2 family transcriptional regulator [Thalassococcus sp. S3]|uniref:RrF2 family transcriptional regulator n=1 Tax=Thalassococcus sp. S3 TaxID=2017482 RepID=UPI0010241201|nr:Rrf2 family transcriptional regulator [Thalassococcus sp. S3]QBF33359.1 transcriptional regulator [Thalassococcus sp. S3]